MLRRGRCDQAREPTFAIAEEVIEAIPYIDGKPLSRWNDDTSRTQSEVVRKIREIASSNRCLTELLMRVAMPSSPTSGAEAAAVEHQATSGFASTREPVAARTSKLLQWFTHRKPEPALSEAS